MKRYIIPALYTIVVFLVLFLIFDKTQVSEIVESIIIGISLFNKSALYILSGILILAIFIIVYLKKISIKNLYFIGYILVFVAILLLPSFVSIFNIEKNTNLNEKRKLAEMPELNLSKDFAQKYEEYYNDNFGLRSSIIKWSGRFKMGVLKVSPKPESVKFGKDGYLFLNSINYEIYKSYSNTNLYSRKQLEGKFQNQLEIENELASKGIKYCIGFWPNKHTVYKDKLPYIMQIQIENDTSFATQVSNYFNKMGLSFFDVTEDLIECKDEKQLYFKFDTHWNSNGAFEGYKSFCKQTYSELGLQAFSIDDFDIDYKEIWKGDLTNMIGIDSAEYYDLTPIYTLKDNSVNYQTIKEEGFPKETVITINENCNNNDIALIFRDSYTDYLIPFLSLHFHKVVYIKKNPVDMDLVNMVQPNIVISCNVERYMAQQLK